MMKNPSLIALIPARAGSKRVPGKNIRHLHGHPLIAYTIAAALESKIFDAVVVSTDSKEYAEIAEYYGAEVPFLRPENLASATSPDIDWVEYTLKKLSLENRDYDCFSILRPTSPFRSAVTLQRAWQVFLADPTTDSLRAVEKCTQHPGKMWVLQGAHMIPLISLTSSAEPWHSSQYAALPEVYVQNASLEMAWTRVVFEYKTIAGYVLKPFFTEGLEGFDINNPEDWLLAEMYSREGMNLPRIAKMPQNNLSRDFGVIY